MEEYELYNLAENEEVDVKEYDLQHLKGLYTDNLIVIRKGMTFSEVRCVLAEELGHYYYTVGDILDQTEIQNIKQEKIARRWAYNKLVPIEEIHKAVKSGNTEIYELAECLEVTEEFLAEALNEYFLKKEIVVNYGEEN